MQRPCLRDLDVAMADKGYDTDHLADRIAIAGTQAVIRQPNEGVNFSVSTMPSFTVGRGAAITFHGGP